MPSAYETLIAGLVEKLDGKEVENAACWLYVTHVYICVSCLQNTRAEL
jgi:hypothetical protein